MAIDINALKSELDTDPLARGYSGMSNAQVVDNLNNILDRQKNKVSLTGKEVKDAFAGNSAEWIALSDTNKQIILALVARDDLDPFGVDADIFQNAATGATNTIATLQTLRVETGISRSVELFNTKVTGGDVDNARRL